MRLARLACALSVPVLVASAPMAATAKTAVYGGSVTRGEPIVLNTDAKAQKLTKAVLALEMTCLDGNKLAPFAASVSPEVARPGLPVTPGALVMSKNAKGSFAGTILTGYSGDTFSVGAVINLKGKLTKKVASGTLTGTATVYDESNGNVLTTCSTGGSKFKAARAAGFVYGGATTQGEPLVVSLNSARTKVSDLKFSWQAACDQTEWSPMHITMEDFYGPLHGSTFSVNLTAPYHRADGGTNVWSYVIKGKISKTLAKGTLKLGYTSLDSNSNTEGTCTAGPLTFKAASG